MTLTSTYTVSVCLFSTLKSRQASRSRSTAYTVSRGSHRVLAHFWHTTGVLSSGARRVCGGVFWGPASGPSSSLFRASRLAMLARIAAHSVRFARQSVGRFPPHGCRVRSAHDDSRETVARSEGPGLGLNGRRLLNRQAHLIGAALDSASLDQVERRPPLRGRPNLLR